MKKAKTTQAKKAQAQKTPSTKQIGTVTLSDGSQLKITANKSGSICLHNDNVSVGYSCIESAADGMELMAKQGMVQVISLNGKADMIPTIDINAGKPEAIIRPFRPFRR